MKKERLSIFKVILMLKTEILKLDQRMERSTNNGILFMLMNGKENQEKEK
jgi:hypothetical protein